LLPNNFRGDEPTGATDTREGHTINVARVLEETHVGDLAGEAEVTHLGRGGREGGRERGSEGWVSAVIQIREKGTR